MRHVVHYSRSRLPPRRTRVATRAAPSAAGSEGGSTLVAVGWPNSRRASRPGRLSVDAAGTRRPILPRRTGVGVALEHERLADDPLQAHDDAPPTGLVTMRSSCSSSVTVRSAASSSPASSCWHSSPRSVRASTERIPGQRWCRFSGSAPDLGLGRCGHWYGAGLLVRGYRRVAGEVLMQLWRLPPGCPFIARSVEPRSHPERGPTSVRRVGCR